MATVIPIDRRSQKLLDLLQPSLDEAPADPVVCSMSLMVRRLEALLPPGLKWNLQKVRNGDYEVRTYKALGSQVGRGMTPTDAIADLVSKLGEITHAA